MADTPSECEASQMSMDAPDEVRLRISAIEDGIQSDICPQCGTRPSTKSVKRVFR